jgi:hypothetical protein
VGNLIKKLQTKVVAATPSPSPVTTPAAATAAPVATPAAMELPKPVAVQAPKPLVARATAKAIAKATPTVPAPAATVLAEMPTMPTKAPDPSNPDEDEKKRGRYAGLTI